MVKKYPNLIKSLMNSKKVKFKGIYTYVHHRQIAESEKQKES